MTHVGLLPLAAVASHEDLQECPAKWIPKKQIKLAKLTYFTNLDFLEIRGFPSSATFGVRSCEVAMSRKSFGIVVISLSPFQPVTYCVVEHQTCELAKPSPSSLVLWVSKPLVSYKWIGHCSVAGKYEIDWVQGRQWLMLATCAPKQAFRTLLFPAPLAPMIKMRGPQVSTVEPTTQWRNNQFYDFYCPPTAQMVILGRAGSANGLFNSHHQP